MFQQLTKPVAIAFWRVNWSAGFNNKESVVFGIKIHFVDDTSWNKQIIAVFKIEIAEMCAAFSGAFMDENKFIGVGGFIKIMFGRVLWCCENNAAMAVRQNGLSALLICFRGLYLRS